MLPLIYGTEPHDIYGQHSVFEICRQLRNHKRLVDNGFHGHGIVSRLENEVAEGGVADKGFGAVDVVVERDVTHTEGQYSGIWDENGANHVGAVGVGGELDREVSHVEAYELVEAYA